MILTIGLLSRQWVLNPTRVSKVDDELSKRLAQVRNENGPVLQCLVQYVDFVYEITS